MHRLCCEGAHMSDRLTATSRHSGERFEDLKSQRTLTSAVYALQAAGFFVGLTFIIAVAINYLKRDQVEDTWLASHFQWQIRTFWFGLLWTILGTGLTVVLIGWVVLGLNTVWVIYRIARGWLRLYDGSPMYSD